MKSVFELLALDPPCLLIGGFAMQRYGLARQTLDVDILIAHSQEKQLETSLSEAGYSLVAESDIFRRYRSDNIYLMDLDAILVDQGTFDQLMASSQADSIDGIDMRIPCLNHLVALKIHAAANDSGRTAKDLLDVSELLRLNPDVVTRDDMERIVRKYGNPDVEQKLEALL